MLKIEITTPILENCVFDGLKEVAKRVEVEIENLSNFDDAVRGLLKLKSEDIENLIKSLPEFCEGFRVTKSSARVLLKEHPCLIASMLLKNGGLITKMRIEGEKIVWSLLCDSESFLKIIEALEDENIDYEIIYKGFFESKDEMTFKEEEILKIALEKGFFEYPRKIKLEELAKQLEIAPSTLSEILRRAQKKMLKRLLE
ncbi:MAG: helix-turn-helix domain-containing protein [Archaeoglobales archaeon]|nr:helix-turn-helix domain-containing protein [Archaeoglobales archaeon]